MEKLCYRRIFKDDEKQVRELVRVVFANIERKDFLIPWTEEQMNRFFDDKYSILFGAYIDNKLVAMTQIFMPIEIEEEYYEILNVTKPNSICELGGFLVLKEYRKKGIMSELSKVTMDYFASLDYDYIISTVHPDNLASNKIVLKLGFDLYKNLTTQSGYLRSLYFKENKKTSD